MVTPTLTLLLSLLLTGPTLQMQAPDTASTTRELSGVVQDTDGAVVQDALVDVVGPTRRVTHTDSQGRFHLAGLSPGDYRLTASLPGFATAVQQVAAGTPGTGLTLTLAVATVAEHVVTVSKVPEETLRTPFLVTSVSARELRETGATTFDEALRSVAGLQHGTQGNAFTRVATRGLRDTADVLVLLDGVPFRQLNGSADLTMIPISMLQGVEFVKGGASSVYGRSAVGGVMQFFLVPDTPGASGDAAFGVASFGTYEGQARGARPFRRGRVAGAAAVSTSDGFQERTGRDTRFATVAADYAASPHAMARLTYTFSDVEAGRGSIVPLASGQPMFGITREQNVGIPGATFDGRLHSLSARVNSTLPGGAVFTNLFNVNRYTRFSTGGITIVPPPTAASKGWNESTSTQDTWINDALVEWQGTRGRLRHALLGGVTVEWGQQEQDAPAFSAAPTYRGPDYVTPVSNGANDPRGIRGVVTTSTFDQFVASGYVQEKVQAGRASLTAGLRWDRFHQTLARSDVAVVSDARGSKVTPRVAGEVTVAEVGLVHLVTFANYTRGFRPQFPALSTQNGVTIPQLLRPEVTRTAEAGARAQSPHLSIQAAFFDMEKLDGQRSFRSGPEDFTFVNATTAVTGVETELRARLPRSVSVFGNYAFQRARNLVFRPTLTTNFDGSRLRMTPRHIAGAGATLTRGRLTWSGSVAYVGSRPLRDNIIAPQVLPSYTLLASSLSLGLGRAQLVLSGTNLTDAYYIADDFSSQDAGNAGMPRRVQAQVRVRF